MRKQVLWLALCTGLALSACAKGPRPRLSTDRLDASMACASWRWIGISRPGARCPDAPGWTVRPLFPQLAPAQQYPECEGDWPPFNKVPGPELIRELNRFCVYEIEDRKKGAEKLSLPPTASADLVRLDRDCAALSLSERYLEARSWDPKAGDFLAQAGKPRTPLEIENHRGVRLSFLDTQRTGEGVPRYQGRSPHGHTLARIAQELVCTGQHCAAHIATRLAMPIIEFDPAHPRDNRIDLEWGGYLGMQSDLAGAIHEEVDTWLQQRTGKSQRHLILNLSMAWDGRLFGGLGGEQIADLRAGTQAVYRALEYAAGFDVLVLAAAGNRQHEPCASYGPLLPAAWEVQGPREKSCDKPKEEQLLYAVGGLNADGFPLDNARPGGMPRRAAYGETGLFAGSSAATAIASSIAAVVWNAFPGLSSREVMEILDGTVRNRSLTAEAFQQDLLSFHADFWSEGNAPAPPVRRLSLCTALARACEVHRSPPPLCGSLPQCVPLNSAGHWPGDGSLDTRGSCQPWLFPQPEIEPCPACIEDPPRTN